MTQLECDILRDLEKRRGHRNAVKAGTLAHWHGVSDRVARQAIENLIEICGIPVASTTKPPYGYYIPETNQEADEYATNLKLRIRGNKARLDAFERALAARRVEQGRLW